MIRLAIVGLGAWGRRLVSSVQGVSDRARFVAALAPRPEKVADFAAAKGLRLSSELDEALNAADVDAVVSCGPAHLHAEHALAALRAGKPVLAVKPMALDPADARRLAQEAESRGLLLALGYNRCFMPHVAALRAELREGALGELLHAEGDFCADRFGTIRDGWKSDPERARAGSLADHPLYLAIETLGPLAEVRAMARSDVSPNALADVTAVLARARGGATLSLTAIGVTADLFRFHVFGTKGWAELRGDCAFRLETTDGRGIDVTLPAVDAERAQIEAFADAMSGAAPYPVPVADAVHGVAALDAIARAATTGETVLLD